MKLKTISLASWVALCGCPADDSGADAAGTAGSDTSGTAGEEGVHGPGAGTEASDTGKDDAPDDGEDDAPDDGKDETADDGMDDTPDDTGMMDDDTAGTDGTDAMCQPTASRIIVLGDSITACAGVGGENSPDCGPRIFADMYADSYNETSYENLAVPGAVTADVVNLQLSSVSTGMPGHALVVIYVGGNDLSPFLIGSDDAAVDGYNALAPQLAASWDSIYAFFDDETNFPDGATVLMNNQYDPFDGCTAAPYYVSQVKLGLLVEYNDTMEARAVERSSVFMADQHGPYLGHGHHNAVSSCPNYIEGAVPWMADLIHPNAAGHANLAEQMAVATDSMYADCE